MRPPALDELGLPLNRGDNEPVSGEMMQRFAAGDFSGFNLPQPSSFPNAAEAKRRRGCLRRNHFHFSYCLSSPRLWS